MYTKAKTPEELRKEAEIRKVLISTLIVEAPLYKTIELKDNYHTDLLFLLNEISFNYYCEDEQMERTFNLRPDSNAHRSLTSRIEPFRVGQTVNTAELFEGVCAACKKYKAYFAFQLFSKLPKRSDGETQPSVFLRKIGQNPAFSISVDKDIVNHLKEDSEHYKKALICISQSYGIAAYAYLRRILENEIKRIAEDIIELKVHGSGDVSAALEKYKVNHQMAPLIDSISDHLPKSVMIDSQNPIKMLYKFYSEAIHAMTEDECLSKAMGLNKILIFVIRQLKKEGLEYNEVRKAIQDLNKLS